MNIIIDTSTIQPNMSGTGYYTWGMLRELLNMESVDEVQTLGGNKALLEKLDNGKINYLFPDETRWHRLLNFTLAGNRANIQGDAAIFPNYFMPPVFPIPSIATIHDLSFLSHPHFYSRKMRTFYRHRIKHTFSTASHILTVSEESKKHILHHSGRKAEEITPVSPGPSLPRDFISQSPLLDTRYFLWNGNIEVRKNIIAVIKAFLASDAEDYKLIITGKRHCDDRYWNDFLQLVESSDRIIYRGYVGNQELKRWYAHASGVAYCSFVEGFGIPAANARAMHKPCLISDHPALIESAGPKVITVNPHDVNDISRGFSLLATTPYLQSSPGVEAYALEYDVQWKYFSIQLEKILKKISLQQKSSTVFSLPRTDLPDLEKAIIKTLSYSAVFGAPIGVKECWLELQHFNCSYNQFKQALSQLAVDYPELILFRKRFAGLKPYVRTIDTYREGFLENNRIIAKHRKLIRFISKLPWIKQLYFSGGTVHGTHQGKADLDLFVVAQTNRVWLVYSMLKLVAFLTGKRDFLCFNFLIDTDNMQVKSQRDLYTAHQILHLKPATDTHFNPDLKHKNPWIFEYFPNSSTAESDPKFNSEIKAKNQESRNVIMETLNLLIMGIWDWFWNLKNVQNRTGGIRWDAHQVKLHTHDHRPNVYNKFSSIQADIQQQMAEEQKYSTDYKVSKTQGYS